MKPVPASFAAVAIVVQCASAVVAERIVPPLSEVQQAIAKSGARWTASETRFSKLTAEERRHFVGGLRIPADFRPYKSDLATALPAPLPSSLDWRSNGGNFVTAVRNQAYCGGCWAFASVGALESRYLMDTNSPGTRVDLSEQIPISCDSNNFGCDGGYLDQAADFLKTQGTYTESCFEFQGSDSSCSYACSEWSSGQRFFKIGGWVGVAQDVNELKTAVYTYGPIPVGMIVCGDMDYYDGGVYSHTSGSCPSDSGHAVLIVGWDDSDGAFIVKNSYDTWWGENGYFRIAYSEVNGDSIFGNMAVAYTGAFGTDDTVRVTVSTQPSGLELTVDGETFNAPRTFAWFPGSEHQVSLQGQKSADGKTFYNFDRRSDGKAIHDPLVASSSDGTFTVYFNTQYQLLTSVNDQKMGTMKPACWSGCWTDKGATVTLSATPAQGHVFSNWTGDVTASDNPHQFAMGKPMSVKANFKVSQGRTYVISAGAGNGGAMEPSGQVSVAEHASQAFTVVPDSGYRISGLQVDGASAGALSTYTFKDVTANHTIYATFAKSGGGTDGGAPQGDGGLDGGTPQRDGGTDGGADAGTDVGGRTGEEAVVSIMFTGDGEGKVASDPAGLSCTKACGHSFAIGTDLELTATPAAGSTFSGWHWGHCGKGTICSCHVDSGKNIIVEFKKTVSGEDENPPDPAAEPSADADAQAAGCACTTVAL